MGLCTPGPYMNIIVTVFFKPQQLAAPAFNDCSQFPKFHRGPIYLEFGTCKDDLSVNTVLLAVPFSEAHPYTPLGFRCPSLVVRPRCKPPPHSSIYRPSHGTLSKRKLHTNPPGLRGPVVWIIYVETLSKHFNRV